MTNFGHSVYQAMCIAAIVYAAVCAGAIAIRRRRHPEWQPHYVRVVVGWLIPAGLGWIASALLYFLATFIASPITSSPTGLAMFRSSYRAVLLYMFLSLAGCAGSIIRYGNQGWMTYMKKTSLVQLSIFMFSVTAGLLSYLVLRYVYLNQ